MAEDLLNKLTRSQYIRWAAWAQALDEVEEAPRETKEKWKSLLITPYEELTVSQKECLRRLAKERLDLFLR
ncbi:MAG: hypothetical protein JW760_10865 [Spirochaetales bacterium]|nr:hypothetical protein [Spirochaetales bacterium]